MFIEKRRIFISTEIPLDPISCKLIQGNPPSHYFVSVPIYIISILRPSYLSSIEVKTDYMSGASQQSSYRERTKRGIAFLRGGGYDPKQSLSFMKIAFWRSWMYLIIYI
jgi:hypothetical protein